MYDRHMIQTRYIGDYNSRIFTTSWTNKRLYPIMPLGMASLRWWMAPIKMDLRCPSTPTVPWQALAILCKTPEFQRKPESLYHHDSPWISGYRVQNISQIITQSHTSHHIRALVHNLLHVHYGVHQYKPLG
jgi:hypothetical protein